METLDLNTVAGCRQAILDDIVESCREAGRSADEVTIVAATKYLAAADIPTVCAAGIHALGENRLDSLAAKRAAVVGSGLDCEWHYIGRLQSRKVAEIVPLVSYIHTLCSESAAQKLAALAATGTELPSLLVQVNTAEDPAKDGIRPNGLASFLENLPPEIHIDGLMTMPEFASDPEHSRGAFSALRELRRQMQVQFHERHNLQHLSMGTSQDFAVAVEEGATFIRLGTILYTHAG